VADHAATADDDTAVQDGVVLDEALLADADGIEVAAQDGAEPDARPSPDRNPAHHVRPVRDERGPVNS